jgi:hypothetical protein
MGRRKAKDFDEEDEEVADYFDSFTYGNDDEDEEESDLSSESDSEEEYDASPILNEVSFSDIVNEHGIDDFADAIIDSISYSDLEKLRDRLNEYLE